MRGIIDRLRENPDPYVQQTLFIMDEATDKASRLADSLPKVNNLESYSLKVMDYHICALRVNSLGYLTEHMSQQEVQTVEVAKDTMIKAKADFNQLYKEKVAASEILNRLNHSKLMMEVRWMLLDKPFDP